VEHARDGEGESGSATRDHQPDLAGTFGLQPHRSETFKLSKDPLAD
jgi:hypothetical protein